MVLHLGGAVVVPIREIVAILHAGEPGPQQPEMLARAAKGGRLVRVDEAAVKSWVLAMRENRETWYLSPISPATLMRRAQWLRRQAIEPRSVERKG